MDSPGSTAGFPSRRPEEVSVMRLDCPPVPRQHTEQEELDRLRADYSARWDILHTTDEWYAVRRDPRPALQGLSAHTARGLRCDLARVEEATR